MRQVVLGAMLFGMMLIGTRAGIAAEMPVAKTAPAAVVSGRSQPGHPASAAHKPWSSHRKRKVSRGTTAPKTAPAHAKTPGQIGQ